MEISYTNKSFIHTPHHKLQLCNVLHVPKDTKNLMSIHLFSLDNNVSFEICPWFFLIKDRETNLKYFKNSMNSSPLWSVCLTEKLACREIGVESMRS
jgi:hypothetical protein